MVPGIASPVQLPSGNWPAINTPSATREVTFPSGRTYIVLRRLPGTKRGVKILLASPRNAEPHHPQEVIIKVTEIRSCHCHDTALRELSLMQMLSEADPGVCAHTRVQTPLRCDAEGGVCVGECGGVCDGFWGVGCGCAEPLEEKQEEGEEEDEYVVRMVDAMVRDGYVFIVTPFMRGGDLFSHLIHTNGGKGLCVKEARRYFTHMTKALLHLKKHGIAHGDVSPENVVLQPSVHHRGPTMDAHLIDLGSADYHAPHTSYTPPSTHASHRACSAARTHTSARACACMGAWARACVCGGLHTDVCVRTGSDDYCFMGKPAYAPPEAYYSDIRAPPHTARAHTHTHTHTHNNDHQNDATTTRARAQTQAASGTPKHTHTHAHAHTHTVDRFASDVWSLGVCLYVMLTGSALYTEPADAGFRYLLSDLHVGAGGSVTHGTHDTHDTQDVCEEHDTQGDSGVCGCRGTAVIGANTGLGARVIGGNDGARRLIGHYESMGVTAVPPLALDLMCAMLCPYPHQRPVLEDVLAHPWILQGVDGE